MSREPENSSWTGERGRVTSLIEKRIPEEPDRDVYICGTSAMAESSLELHQENGFLSDKID